MSFFSSWFDCLNMATENNNAKEGMGNLVVMSKEEESKRRKTNDLKEDEELIKERDLKKEKENAKIEMIKNFDFNPGITFKINNVMSIESKWKEMLQKGPENDDVQGIIYIIGIKSNDSHFNIFYTTSDANEFDFVHDSLYVKFKIAVKCVNYCKNLISLYFNYSAKKWKNSNNNNSTLLISQKSKSTYEDVWYAEKFDRIKRISCKICDNLNERFQNFEWNSEMKDIMKREFENEKNLDFDFIDLQQQQQDEQK